MSITESNLDALIDKKDTERGRLLSRWIGLLPLEEKDALAREHFNQHVKPYLISNQYDSETLKNEIGAFNVSIKQNEQLIKEYESKDKELDKEITNLEQTRNALLSSKQQIDETLLKVDITTLETKITTTTEEGKKKKYEIENVDNEIKKIGDVDFSVEEYDKTVSQLNILAVIGQSLLSSIKTLNTTLNICRRVSIVQLVVVNLIILIIQRKSLN